MINSEYKIGIDFHGVITENPSFFCNFTKAARSRGWKIHIISGGPYQKVKDYLDEQNIEYDQIFALVDYFAEKGKVKFEEDGSFEVEKDLWNTAKSKYCSENAVNIQIDDSPEYGVSFSTPFCHYNPEKKVCEVDGYQIDFSVSPESSLQAIEKYIKQG